MCLTSRVKLRRGGQSESNDGTSQPNSDANLVRQPAHAMSLRTARHGTDENEANR